MRRLVTVVGARPQFIKASAISRQLTPGAGFEELLVHTGQHYDVGMSDRFFDELGIPTPAYSLGVGSGSHAAQTAEMLRRLEEIFLETKPAAVVVYGHLHIPRTTWYDGVRFEEVSIGYPREWRKRASGHGTFRQILPLCPAKPGS